LPFANERDQRRLIELSRPNKSCNGTLCLAIVVLAVLADDSADFCDHALDFLTPSNVARKVLSQSNDFTEDIVAFIRRPSTKSANIDHYCGGRVLGSHRPNLAVIYQVVTDAAQQLK
jgi:hypothetical protein